MVWTVAVSAALTNATGLGIANLTGGAISQPWGAVAHSLFGFAFVWFGGYDGFEKLMKTLVAIMGFSILMCAILTLHDPVPALRGLVVPTIPAGSGTYVLSIIGGIGGSITMLSYNYWMREEKMSGPRALGYVRGDVAIGYVFTALFGISIMLIADQAFFRPGVTITDAQAVSKMAEMLGTMLGPFGVYAYSVGFWAAVFASLLGVWQSIPYLYADFYGIVRKLPPAARERADQGHLDAVSARLDLHHARAAAVRVHPPPADHHRHLHDRRQPVRPVPRGDAALPEQPRPVDDAGAAQSLDDERAAGRDPRDVPGRRRAGGVQRAVSGKPGGADAAITPPGRPTRS